MKITETALKSLSSTESFARGYELYQVSAVYDTYRQENTLTGKCEGSSAPFYQLRVIIDEGGIQEAACTCPYDWGGYCKHIIALILTFIHNQGAFIEQKRIDELLMNLDHETLVQLIGKMVDKNPDLYLWLQAAVPSPSAQANSAQPSKKRKTQVSKSEYCKQIQGILHSLGGYRRSEAYWMMGGMVEQLHQVRDSGYAFMEAGDVEGALVILTTLLTEVSESFEEFDDSDGELGSFLNELALPVVEAILSADLSKSERYRLAKELEPVIDGLSDYGIDGLDVILTALKKGWSIERSLEPEEVDYEDAILLEAQLNVLERQNRVDEFLNICLETGQYLRYILKQIEVGAFDQAAATAWKTLTLAPEMHQVARRLRDSGHLEEALRLAEKGLGLDGSKHNLGIWLGPIEETQGRIEEAIHAYQAAFTSVPSLELYQTLEKLSGNDWGSLKPALMQVFVGDRYAEELVDIYLFEEEWDAAIAVADRVGAWNYNLIEKVADGVLTVRQDWVIQASQRQAQGLINKTQSKYYAIAAHWLDKMKQAYLSAGRKSEWQIYLEGLKSTYSRRPALQAALMKLEV
jgi:uncharacterized Zn finger protein